MGLSGVVAAFVADFAVERASWVAVVVVADCIWARQQDGSGVFMLSLLVSARLESLLNAGFGTVGIGVPGTAHNLVHVYRIDRTMY